jgi:SAM-dependent methyltransferase
MKAKTSEWYDKVFAENDEYNRHYDQSRYFDLWTAIVHMLFPREKVLDIGCGPGQFAQMCVDHGHDYVGVDFSQVAIETAVGMEIPHAYFIHADVSKLGMLPVDYDKIDVVTFVEVLEHIDNDIEVLGYYAQGKPVILTLPDFMAISHVRSFNDENEIRERYKNFLFTRIERVGHIFVVQGQSRNHTTQRQ